MDYLALIMQIALGLMLLLSAMLKLLSLGSLLDIMNLLRLTPNKLNKLIAVLLVCTELVTGSLVLFGFLARLAAIVGSLLFVGFIGLHSYALVRKIDMTCGCHGKWMSTRLGKAGLVQNSIYLIYAIPIIIWSTQPSLSLLNAISVQQFFTLILLPALLLLVISICTTVYSFERPTK
ncbi:MauE/DoxX family redox-associated membrane protein [Paenibacillus sp. FSL R5-0623]|uniref:MauE/DoxX family redox-associated membrane protein n=1 Tax=Paenibacillus sp. FSL R5-0623 TaxID=2921651 RepID=UPI0030D83A57